MSADKISLNKESMDKYLKEVAKEYKRMGGRNVPAELILIGGASIVINYGFRGSTYDIDAMILAASCMKDAINNVTDKFNLNNGWLNDSFKNTDSYTSKLAQYSKHYKTFSNVLNIRTVSDEYLLAMKLVAYRPYKHDISDIVGILLEHEKRGNPLTFDKIDTAVHNLYDGWDRISKEAQDILREILSSKNLEELYDYYSADEAEKKDMLIEFEQKYPKVLKTDNMADIINSLKAKQQKQQVVPETSESFDAKLERLRREMENNKKTDQSRDDSFDIER